MQKQESEENTTGPFELRTDANVGYVPLLSQVIGSEPTRGIDTMLTVDMSRPLPSTTLISTGQLIMTESMLTLSADSASRSSERRRVASTNESLTEEERLKRRRQINRNSQRRIRERRAKELEDLRSEFLRVRHENEQLRRQHEVVSAEKTELMRQVKETTDNWQQTISNNAILNREILQLKARVEELESIIRTSNIKPPTKNETNE